METGENVKRRWLIVALVLVVIFFLILIGLKIYAINSGEEVVTLDKAQIGDSVVFGSYEGCNEWIVLDKDGDRVLLLSKYAIKEGQYHDKWSYTSWENCTLRKWLNNDYIDEAFSEEEQELLIDTKVDNKKDTGSNEDDGNDTIDKVYILSMKEVEKYLQTEEERKLTLKNQDEIYWWLRTPGAKVPRGDVVSKQGELWPNSEIIHHVSGGIRPVLWVDVSKMK